MNPNERKQEITEGLAPVLFCFVLILLGWVVWRVVAWGLAHVF